MANRKKKKYVSLKINFFQGAKEGKKKNTNSSNFFLC